MRHIMYVCLQLLVLLAIGACRPISSTPQGGESSHEQVSIILTAFGDKDAQGGETQPFLLALENRVDRTDASAFCTGVYEGTLYDQSVVVVTTGTGGDNAGPCMHELLFWYGDRLKEVIWSGIGGATPAVGGLVDDGGQVRPNTEPVMIGDVCISSLAWNYDLHFSSVADWRAAQATGTPHDPSGGWWPMKNSDGKADVPGFETVQQYVIADTALADELLAAAEQVNWPPLEQDVVEKIERYFPADQLRDVAVFDYTQCGEVGGNDFWHGVTEDWLARGYLASLISTADPSTTVTENEVVVFSAMEAQAWMSVLDRWADHQDISVPMAVIRAASNYDHSPIDADGNPAPDPAGTVPTAMDDIQKGFQEAGASFAWNNAVRPVLKLLELRSQP